VSHGLWGGHGRTDPNHQGQNLPWCQAGGGCNKGTQDQDDWLGENQVAAIRSAGNPLDSSQCANAKGLQSKGLELLGWGADHKGLRSSRCDEGGCLSFQKPGLVDMLELGAELLLLCSDLCSIAMQRLEAELSLEVGKRRVPGGNTCPTGFGESFQWHPHHEEGVRCQDVSVCHSR